MENKFNVKSAVFLAVLLLVAVVAAAYIVTANWDKISNDGNLGPSTDTTETTPADDDQTAAEAIEVIVDVADEEGANTEVEVNNPEETPTSSGRVDENGIEIAP